MAANDCRAVRRDGTFLTFGRGLAGYVFVLRDGRALDVRGAPPPFLYFRAVRKNGSFFDFYVGAGAIPAS
jgi:hypothetical protein